MHDITPAPRLPDPVEFGRAWTAAVRRTSYISMTRTALQAYLTDLATALVRAFTACDFDRTVPHDVGAALVEVHFTESMSLERSLVVIAEQFGSAVGTPDRAARFAAMQGALAAGFATALQERTRAEQERISVAAFAARGQAEQARWNSEARFRAVFATAAIGIGVADVDGTVIEVNHALCEMFGTPHRSGTGSRSSS
jgi:PAS domain S-box